MPQKTGNVKSVDGTINARTNRRISQKTGYRTPSQSPTIEEIKEKVDIVALINGRVNLKKAGKGFKGLCPFHEEESPSFTVSPSKQIYCCFGCNRSGDAITFLEEYDKLSKKDAIEYLARQVGLVSGFSSSIENQKPKTKAKTKPTQPEQSQQPEQPEQSQQPEQPEQPEQSQQSQEVTQQAKKEQAKKETRSLVTSDFDDFPIREKADQNSWKVKQLREENEIKGDVYQIIYPYSDTQRIIRYEWMSEGKEKADKYFQYSCVNPENNQWAYKKGVGIWAYKLDEVVRLSSNPSSQIILHLEGEKSVEIARQNGISAFSLRGSDKDKKTALSLLPKDSAIVFLLDNDTSGKKQGENLANICNEIGLEFHTIEVGEVCPDLKDTPKADIEEILGLISRDNFIEKVESLVKEKSLISLPIKAKDETNDNSKSEPKALPCFNQQAFSEIFDDGIWICASDVLYKWKENHYEKVKDSLLLPKIANFCNDYIEFKKGLWTYPYANTASAKEVLNWAKMRLTVNPDLINPPGINCKNGVLQIQWFCSTPSWILTPHTPDKYYIYPPIVEYNPNAKTDGCDKLLDALRPAQREIFLRTIAASLDLETVRKFKGRNIKALLLKGRGNNGKDAIREAVSLLHGNIGVTSCTLSDFAAYDEGRKFSLARLITSKINWASENSNTAKIDTIQCLKAFITGQKIDSEKKGIQGDDFNPMAIALFNVNDCPNLNGQLEAIKSRYAIISFQKTYKTNADPSKGEVEADPRFVYDRGFLENEVLPAFLNRVLAALVDLMEHGIDYSATEEDLEEIQAENSHLFRFARDTGLDYCENATVKAKDLWEVLEAWYLDNGTLTYEETNTGKKKAIWFEQANNRDRNVKAVNQIIPRILTLFPNAKQGVIWDEHRNKIPVICGLSFSDRNLDRTQSYPDRTQLEDQIVPNKPLPSKDFVPNRTQFSTYTHEKKINGLNSTEKPINQTIGDSNTIDIGVVDLGETPKNIEGEENPQNCLRLDTKPLPDKDSLGTMLGTNSLRIGYDVAYDQGTIREKSPLTEEKKEEIRNELLSAVNKEAYRLVNLRYGPENVKAVWSSLLRIEKFVVQKRSELDVGNTWTYFIHKNDEGLVLVPADIGSRDHYNYRALVD